jgi:transposase
MYYTGLDVHEQYTEIQHMDAQGYLGFSTRISTDRASLRAFFDQLDDVTSVTLEAGRQWWWIHEFLKDHPRVARVKVLDPFRSRKIAKELSVLCGYGRAKNDRIDAEMMAEEDRRRLAPAIHVPNSEQLEQKTVVRHRTQLVQDKTAASARLQALFALHGVRISTKSLLDNYKSQLVYLDSLPAMLRFIVHEWVDQLRLYQRQIRRCERKLSLLLPERHPKIKLLMTAPGIGEVVARIIATELFSIENFKEPKYLISYAGLAPVDQESASKKGVIKLNQHSNYYLKYAFMTAAHAARTHPKYRRKYDRDVKKYGKTIAKLNLARRIAKTVYWMLTRQQPFQ